MNHPDTLFQQALALHQQGQIQDASSLYQQVLALQPNHFDALHLSGVIAAQSGQYQQALTLIAQAIALNPNEPQAFFNYALTYQQMGHPDVAVIYYQKTISLFPNHAEAHNNLGSTLYQLKRLEEALAHAEQAIMLNPSMALAYNNHGLILNDLHRYHEALSSYDRALSFDPHLPQAHYNRGNTLRELHQLEAAKSCYLRAIEFDSAHVKAHNNYGFTLFETLHVDEALLHYHRALAIDPDFADAHFNLSVLLLSRGDYAQGWKEYEWRWKCTQKEGFLAPRDFIQPLWLGRENLAGKTILLHAEQGFGDTLQFCRYIPLVAKRGARVILEGQEPLLPLLSNLEGVTHGIAAGEPLPPFDYHCPLMSLPLAFNTTLETIPVATRYLNSNPQQTAHWASRLGLKTKPRIGLVWQGSLKHRNDHNRSVSLKALLERLPTQFQYICLQKDLFPIDLEALEHCPDVLHFGKEIADFGDTAALCDLMDLVISVDTSVAHLAGALGRPLWILLPKVPDWRWLLEGTGSPWYPNAKLYRQPNLKNWDAVFDQISKDLQMYFSGTSHP